MPTYVYLCKECGAQIEVTQGIFDDPLQQCFSCQQIALTRVPQAPMVFVRGSTMGSLAEHNSRLMGHYEKSELTAKQKEAEDARLGPKPFYNEERKASNAQINKMSEDKKQNYIMTGEV